MAEFGDDCYFFFYSNCQHGAKCQFRHVAEALGTEIVCSSWRNGRCQRRNCPYRHMSIEKNRSDIPCYWESQPGGCQKNHCVFKHLKSRKVQEESNDTPPRNKIIKLPQKVIEKAENSTEQQPMDILTNSTSVDTACDLNLNNVDEDKKIKPKSIQATDRQAGDARIVITNRRTVMANSGLNEDVKFSALSIDANRSDGEENGSTKRKIIIRRRKQPDLLIGVPSSDDVKGCSGSEEDDVQKTINNTTQNAVDTTKKHWRKRSRSDELAPVDDATQCKLKRSESSGKLSAESSQNLTDVETNVPKNAQVDAEMTLVADNKAALEEPKTPLFSDEYKTKLVEVFGADLAASFINQGIKLDLTQMS